MRITKKMLRQAKSGAIKRIKELCDIMEKGKIQGEHSRCFPEMQGRNDFESLRILLIDLVDRTIPGHWTE